MSSEATLPATEAYLAAFARGHGLRLATFDRGMTRHAGVDVFDGSS